eukprot:5955202-Pyramimonas_sp.AAC.1
MSTTSRRSSHTVNYESGVDFEFEWEAWMPPSPPPSRKAIYRPSTTHVFLMNDNTEELPAAFDVFIWNDHSYQRVADLFRATCAHVERVVVKEGYIEYPARYITVEIRKTGTNCP